MQSFAEMGTRLRAMNEVTRIFSAIESGEPRAAGPLLPLVPDELRRVAEQLDPRHQK